MATLAWFFFALALLGSAVGEDDHSTGQMFQDNLKKVANANNRFALNLYLKLTEDTDENIFISPFSISSVLTMLYKGTRGETAQELRKLLGFRRAKLDDSVIFSTMYRYLTEIVGKFDPNVYTINTASALIVDDTHPLRPEYIKGIQELYQAYVQEVDISQNGAKIVDDMNTWVQIKSNGTIQSLVDVLDPSTTLLLVSAVYFKASWRRPFNPAKTKYHPFYNGGRIRDASHVPMMFSFDFHRFYEEDEFSAVELEYEGRNMSMIIFLPQRIDGIGDIEEGMTPSRIAYVRRYMLYEKIDLAMPKLKLGFDRDLTKELQELGLEEVFGSRANLAGMIAGGQMPFLSEVRHKATVEVAEKGTVAFAVTTFVKTKALDDEDSEPRFHMDHPFLFAIVDTSSGMILFMGKVNKL